MTCVHMAAAALLHAGFNRTGFVVCSYLIEHCGLSVEQALASFARARPPGVKHEKFRDELHARYGSINQSVPRPITCKHAAAVYAACNCSSATLAECIERGLLLPPFLQPHLLGLPAAAGASPTTADAAGTEAHFSSCSCCSSSTQVQGWGSSTCSCCSSTGLCDQAAGLSPPAAAALGCKMLGAAGVGGNARSRQQHLLPLPCMPGGLEASAAIAEGCAPDSSSQLMRGASPSSSCARAELSSSPLPHLPARCYSSCSVGDNSSIGCSPDSGVDCILHGGSNTSSSGMGGSVRGYRVPFGLVGCSPVIGGQQQVAGSSPGQHSSNSSTAGGRLGQPYGGEADIAATAAAVGPPGADADDAEQLQWQRQQGEAEDAGVFEMDPCGELQGGIGSSWCDGAQCCCVQPQNQQQDQQRLHAAELTGLMEAVALGQQQPRQHLLQGQEAASVAPAQQQDNSSSSGQQYHQQVQLRQQCPCSCHTGSSTSSGAGGVERTEQRARRRSRLRHSQVGSDGSGPGSSGGPELVDNESFGKITSAELLKKMR